MNLHNLFESQTTRLEFGRGDPVIITGDVRFRGKTGDVREIGQDGAFVVVNLYNYGSYSFHASDVSLNDYADSNDDEEYQSGVAEAGSAATGLIPEEKKASPRIERILKMLRVRHPQAEDDLEALIFDFRSQQTQDRTDIARLDAENDASEAEISRLEKMLDVIRQRRGDAAVAEADATTSQGRQRIRDVSVSGASSQNKKSAIKAITHDYGLDENRLAADKTDRPRQNSKLKRRMDDAFGRYSGYRDQPQAFFKRVMNSADHSQPADQLHDDQMKRVEHEIAELSQRLGQVNEQHGAAVANRFSQRLAEHFESDRPEPDHTRQHFAESRTAKRAAIKQILSRTG